MQPAEKEQSQPVDPLSAAEREEHEADLIAFADGELDRLGDIVGLDVLYAGGASPLWLEGLSQRIGPEGTLTALELDPDRLDDARWGLRHADLVAPIRLVRGSVSDSPFEKNAFDLVYSSGLFHELDVREGGAGEAVVAMTRVVRPGGRVATSDFVDTGGGPVPVQLEDERLDAEDARRERGAEPFGIGPPERLVRLFGQHLQRVRWDVAPPTPIRHLDRIVLAASSDGEGRDALRRRILGEGYTRPHTLYVEGLKGEGG